jgi:hypothetical protein
MVGVKLVEYFTNLLIPKLNSEPYIVQDVETAGVAVSEALELFHGLRSHASERGETLEQCWKSLSL